MKRFSDFFKNTFSKLKKIRGSPHEIAKSFAIGVFIGVLPGTGLAVALIVALIFRLKKTAVALGALTNNPWTTTFVYAGSYKIGRWMLAIQTPVAWRDLFSWQGFSFKEWRLVLTPFLLGGLVLAIASAAAAYVAVYFAMTFYRSKIK